MKIIITNSSRYPDAEVRWLVNFAARQVRPVAEREHWDNRLDANTTSVRVTNYSRSFRGLHLHLSQACSIGRPWRRPSDIPADSWVRDILIRIGAPARFPINDFHYPKFKGDMPEHSVADWQEALVMVAAHELSHTRYNGKKQGEYNCELISSDATEAFRRERASYDEFVAKQAASFQEREVAIAAKRSPEAVFATKLAKAQKDLARWTRKQKLASGKVKKYQRAVKRLEKISGALPEKEAAI